MNLKQNNIIPNICPRKENNTNESVGHHPPEQKETSKPSKFRKTMWKDKSPGVKILWIWTIGTAAGNYISAVPCYFPHNSCLNNSLT